ncbi:MAG: isoprenyl transferase [Bacteroidales bacterium]|nr:isoprenyl transferase [Bacteroidales bacterium]HOY38400.1 isoprenyl transferase [Bacteroidales bacterium]HQP04331.1 isoprenyl transferase [Bacteroidales bacterium]
MSLLEKLDKTRIPVHIAIIMDGNGRWAKEKGQPRMFGHKAGVQAVKRAIIGAREAGVQYLTLYAFSTENWNRPQTEVLGLMDLLVNSIESEIEELHKNGVCLRILGDMSRLSRKVYQKLQFACEKTKNNSNLQLLVALSYSGRWEIAEAARRIATDACNHSITPDEINESLFARYLTSADIPDPELLIRTSGEMRISNFLLYQLAYSEFYFPPLHWPDFTKETLFEAIYNYQNRERRFGKTSEQIKN